MIPVSQRILGLEALPITLYMGLYLLSRSEERRVGKECSS